MKVHGKNVIFGHTHCYSFDTDYGYVHGKEQHWEIPALQLQGWVRIFHDGNPISLTSIKMDIESEVRFDLEQREKRKHGIAA